MHKVARKVSALLGRVVFIGLSAQMLLGLLWMLGNFGYFQEYEKSFFLLEVSETLVCDEYTGILYPLLIRLAKGVSLLLPIPYYCILYVLQSGLGFFAAFFFIQRLIPGDKLGGRGKVLLLWGSGVMNTVPFVLQCHLAVLPASLGMSLVLLMLGICLEGRKKKGFLVSLCSLGLLWLLLALLLPEFLIPGGVLFGLYGIRGIFTGWRKLSVAFLILVPVISALTIQTGAYGRMEKSWESAAMRRYAWSSFGSLYGYWPPELQTALTQEEIAECLEHSENMVRLFGEKIDRVYGSERAREIYSQVAEAGRKNRGVRNRYEIALDLAGHGMAPVSHWILLRGRGQASFTERNYDIMRRNTPVLTSRCVAYSAWWFCAGLALTLILEVLRFWEKKSLRGAGPALLCVAAGAGIVLLYTLQGGGVMDYKESIAVTALWFAWMCSGAINELGSVE